MLSAPVRRVVLDTNVLLSLFVFAGSRYLALRTPVERGDWIAYANQATLAEYRQVLARAMFGLSPAQQEAAWQAWRALAHMDETPPAEPGRLPRCSDRDDQKFLELTLASGADWLVTADKALLKLNRRQKLRGLFQIVTPDAMLALLTADAASPAPSL